MEPSTSQNSKTESSGVTAKESTRIWRRTSLYMLRDLKIMMVVKTYVYAKGDKPTGNEMLLCHFEIDSASVEWTNIDRLIMLSGTDGVIPLADSNIGLVLEGGKIIDAEIGKSRNDYFFKVGGTSDEKRKVRMATGRLQARQRSDDVSNVLEQCLALFGMDEDESPKVLQRDRNVRKEERIVSDAPEVLDEEKTPKLNESDLLNFEGDELPTCSGVIVKGTEEIVRPMSENIGASECDEVEGTRSRDEILPQLLRYVEYLRAKGVDVKGVSTLPDDNDMIKGVGPFLREVGINSLDKLLVTEHSISKVSVRDLEVWYISAKGVIKDTSVKGKMCAIVEAPNSGGGDDTKDVMIGLLRE